MATENFIREITRKPKKPLKEIDPKFISQEPWASIDKVLPIPSIPKSLAEKLQAQLAQNHKP